jgi:hypothetical protein
VLGLDAKAIASAFLTSPAAMGKRLVRAKDKIRQAGIPFAVPERAELPGRLDAVLDAIYAAFGEGWTDPGGTDVARRDLTDEALFLARLVTELLPQEPEALGLLALMLHAHARRRARRTPGGDYVPLAEQDPGSWDADMIAAAEALLHRAGALGAIGRYQLEGALQSAHVYRCRTGRANWAEVVKLYDALAALAGSPVGDQPRARNRRARRRRRCARGDAGSCRRCAARRIPALLGRARGAVGADRRERRSPPRLRDRHRTRARRRGPPLFASAAGGAGGLIVLGNAVDCGRRWEPGRATAAALRRRFGRVRFSPSRFPVGWIGRRIDARASPVLSLPQFLPSRRHARAKPRMTTREVKTFRAPNARPAQNGGATGRKILPAVAGIPDWICARLWSIARASLGRDG